MKKILFSSWPIETTKTPKILRNQNQLAIVCHFKGPTLKTSCQVVVQISMQPYAFSVLFLSKGQLISECPFDVLNFPRKNEKN